MATLTVWKFDSPTGAVEALGKLAEVQKQHLIEILDAAIVEWPQGKKKPKTRQVNDLAVGGAPEWCFLGDVVRDALFRSLLWHGRGCRDGCSLRSFRRLRH